MTCDAQQVGHDKWPMTYDLPSKFYLPSSSGLGVIGDMSHMACDTGHKTPDMWNAIFDMCHGTQRGWWTLNQNFRLLVLTVSVWRCFKDIWTKGITGSFKYLQRSL